MYPKFGYIFFVIIANNKCMKVLLIITTVIIVLLTISLPISVLLNYDIINNEGKIKLNLFGIPIFLLNFTIAGEYLNLSNKRNKVITIKLDLNDEKVKFFNDFGLSIKKKIYLMRLGIYALICSENPIVSSTLGALINAMIGVVYSKMSIVHSDADFKHYISTGFRQNEMKVKLDFALAFSLYDILWAFLRAYKSKIRRKYEEKNKLQQHRRIKRNS